MEGPPLFLPSDKPQDYTGSTYYGRCSELVTGPHVTDDSIIYEDTFDSDNKKDKGAGNDDNREEEDDNWGEGDDGGAGNLDSEVEEEEGNDEANNEDYSRSGHLRILSKALPLDTPGKPPLLDTPSKFLNITEDTIVISDGSKISKLIATLVSILIVIVVNTIMRSETFVSGNPTPGNNPAIPFIVELFAANSDAADFQKLLDITENVVVILDRSKVFRLIATLISILIAIIVDTTACSRTSASRNPNPGNNPTILSVVELSAMSNNTANFFADVLSNSFGNFN